VKQARLRDYAGIRERIQQSYFGFELTLLEKGALDSTDEEIYRTLKPRWAEGGFGIWLGSYVDMSFVEEANAKVRSFLHDRIREKVKDPATAELLTPKGYPFGCKRNPLDSGYFETFNEPHVQTRSTSGAAAGGCCGRSGPRARAPTLGWPAPGSRTCS
jgi:cyclohexanone monooxygenase